ncbi:MAG: 30S ribosomal protein S12 methylthiotransferase accessory factor YcaO [Rhodocyclaceae bacterium]|nr:30S ribosomal protein S12 methylthiotransferase accessory factor YcaO [Rhodocyclaceae bacterium]
MHSETLIPGKDAALETSIATMRHTLAQLGFHIEECSWLNPVAGVWSVHIRDRDCPQMFANGKGASQLACLASALGEFFERLSTRYFWNHYYLGAEIAHADYAHDPRERWFPLPADDRWPAELLTAALQAFYNPEGDIPARALVDFNTGHAARGICALPYQRQQDGATVWFPVNIIGNLYVSNGMAAGNTPAEARTQALSEIFERHVKFRIIAEGLCLPEVPEAVIARHRHVAAGIAALRQAGYGILVRDASLGGQYPVINVTLLNPRDQGCYASFGAHPCFAIALERALTELLQGRALDALDGFPPPGFDLDEVAESPNLEIHFVDSSGILHWRFLADTPDFPFCDWNFSTPATSTAHDSRWLIERIHALGHEVYIADYDRFGIPVCRILVPGMSEIYPVDDLAWENNSVGNALREPILRLPELDAQALSALLAALEASGVEDGKLVRALIGLLADPGTLWEDLRVGELKALLALAIGEREAIAAGMDWVLHFGEINAERARVYRCIDALLHLEVQGLAGACGEALEQLYGADTVATSQALLEGRQRFFGLTAPGLQLTGCGAHQRLLAAYRKAQQAG